MRQRVANTDLCPPVPIEQGAGAISSDAYFGREQRNSSGAGGSANLDMSASDLVSKIGITARQDMDSIKQASPAVLLLVSSRAAVAHGCCKADGSQWACTTRLHLPGAQGGLCAN